MAITMDGEVPNDLCSYRRSASHPEKRAVEIMLKAHAVSLKLDISAMGVTLKGCRDSDRPDENGTNGHRPESPLRRVLEAHAEFKAKLQPDLVDHRAWKDIDAETTTPQTPPDLREGSGFRKRCTSDINTISLFFPDLAPGPVHSLFAAWLAYICAVDDILEAMPPPEARQALVASIALVRGPQPGSAVRPADPRIPDMTTTLSEHVEGMQHIRPPAARVFLAEVAKVLRAHHDELDFLDETSDDLGRYLGIRRRTISLAPFFAVLKASFLPNDTQHHGGLATDTWGELQDAVSLACGLQNDLIGIEKDLEKGDRMNAVLVLLRSRSGGSVQDLDAALFRACVAEIVRRHNRSVDVAMARYRALTAAAGDGDGGGGPRTGEVARQIILLVETHMRWCASAKRYRVKAEQRYDSPPDGWDGIQELDGKGELLPVAELPTPAASLDPAEGLLGSKKRKRDEDELSQLARMTPAPEGTLRVVRSEGIYHGLPTYTDSRASRDLTAIVTGATGVSGYHIVKVLAASPRWRRIYALSARPPPANFFADLGVGAARVEHLAVDFLAEPGVIAGKLKMVQHVDHIFYASYTHPHPRDNVLNFWADPAGLNKANWTMFTNFLAALQQTALTPRRFILQTGTKHYGFYLGPAPLPAFESDPRVALGPNFYYAQEDALARFCLGPAHTKTTNTTWAVARPSYVVGAVPDGTLNHLLGIAVYAAVQARRGRRLRFPGDYRAWDREQVQSTGLLNGYFAEWLALTDMGSGEAFNIHDGQNFTWGRLWPCVARWFGLEWSAPETDPDKYRVVTMPGATPRGYGPQATLNSTFSLLEWSQQPEVEDTWKELAREHGLVLDPFADAYRARVFAFADSAVVGDGAMTTSLRKARAHGFLGTVDSFRSVFEAFHEMARLKLTVAPRVTVFEERE